MRKQRLKIGLMRICAEERGIIFRGIEAESPPVITHQPITVRDISIRKDEEDWVKQKTLRETPSETKMAAQGTSELFGHKRNKQIQSTKQGGILGERSLRKGCSVRPNRKFFRSQQRPKLFGLEVFFWKSLPDRIKIWSRNDLPGRKPA